MQVGWSATQIRFDEQKQLIDVVDVLSVVCKSQSSAKVMQNSFLGANSIEATAAMCNCKPEEIVHKIVWMDAGSARTCVSVANMLTILRSIKKLPNAVELAAILDVGKLTVKTAHRFEETGTCPETAVGEVEATEAGATFTLTRSEAFAHANSRLVEYTANEWLRTTNMETMARQQQLNLEQLKRMADEWSLARELHSKQRKLDDEVASNQLKLDAEVASNQLKLDADVADTKLKNKIKLLRELGEDAKADKLLEKLITVD